MRWLCGSAWSGSPIGYHTRIYTVTLQPRRAGEHFDSEWGGIGEPCSRTTGSWADFSYEQIEAEIRRQAQVDDLKPIEEAAAEAQRVFEECKDELLPTFDALIATFPDETLKDLRSKIDKLPAFIFRDQFEKHQFRGGGSFFTRDSTALAQGIQLPPHLQFNCWLMAKWSFGSQVEDLGKHAMHAVRYLQQRHKMKGKTIAKKDGKIFIGHGRSAAWRDLKDFIQDNLGLVPDEFNRESPAGKSNKERLLEMLDGASFAFLVMTAEDDRADGTKHARENVIHEAGLFQGRLEFERAIILLEDGCTAFSNIDGLGQIRFPPGNIMAKSEEIRKVLQREGIIS
jgi:predicted nucleotide-binding protein